MTLFSGLWGIREVIKEPSYQRSARTQTHSATHEMCVSGYERTRQQRADSLRLQQKKEKNAISDLECAKTVWIGKMQFVQGKPFSLRDCSYNAGLRGVWDKPGSLCTVMIRLLWNPAMFWVVIIKTCISNILLFHVVGKGNVNTCFITPPSLAV